MQTANFSIVVLIESNFTKQSALSTGRWVEWFKNMIEHPLFKKKKVEKFLITLFLKELEALKVVVIVHNPDKSAMPCWAAIFCYCFWTAIGLAAGPLNSNGLSCWLSAYIRLARSKSDDWFKKIFRLDSIDAQVFMNKFSFCQKK